MMVLLLSLKLLLMSLLGYISRRACIVEDDFCGGLSRLLVDVIIPCYVLKAVLSIEDLAGLVAQNGSALVSAVLLMAVLFLIGAIGRRLLGGNVGRIFQFGTMFSNALVFGMPIAEAYWGMPGLLYLMTFYIPVRLGYYGLAEGIISPDQGSRKEQVRRGLKFFVSPAFLAYVTGALFLGFQIQVPQLFLDFISSVGACTTPLGMMLIGMIIGGYPIRQVVSWKNLLMSIYKLVALPALIGVMLAAIGIKGMPAVIMVLYTALPCGSLLTTFCIQYDPDSDSRVVSAGWVVFTTALAVLTVPLWLSLITHFHLFGT